MLPCFPVMAHAALEGYDTRVRGWSLDHFDIAMTAPQYMRIVGYPLAWSPSIDGTLTGTPVIVEVRSNADFAKYHGTLKGKIVMWPPPGSSSIRKALALLGAFD